MKQSFLPFEHELVVDLFAGGGGASLAMREALGRDPDIAINHDPDAVDMHTVNHPGTQHYCEDVYAVDPVAATRGMPVGLLHASPDCTDHSQAKGGQPRRKEIRSLAWVVLKWAGRTSPRCITLENVTQMLSWSPLVAKRDPATGRVVKVDRSVAAEGERVPVRQQFLVGCGRRRGSNWERFVGSLRGMGYVVEWRTLRACDYGAGTSRERLFLMARRDGLPIVWPKITHGRKRPLKPFVTAAECIDWSIPCPSIFDRPKPLVDATLRRVATGLKRFVIDAANPFIVPVTHRGGDRGHSCADPLPTITTAHRGEFMVCSPTLVQTSYGERRGQAPRALDIHQPLGTIVAGGIKHAAVAAFLEQANTGMVGHDARDPLSTIVQKGCTQRLISASMCTLRRHSVGTPLTEPLRTMSAGGEHHALLEYQLSPEAEAGALRVAAFLILYYGTGGQWADLRDPMSAITTRDRLALVTVHIKGVPHVIVDIGLRMFTARELFLAQGFPLSYIINRRTDGRAVTKTAQVRMVGNSVSPPPYRALLLANFQHERKFQQSEVA